MTTEIERLEAELSLAKTCEKFRKAKAEGKATRKMRHDLRAARQHYRENFRVGGPGTVQPATIVGTAGTEDLT